MPPNIIPPTEIYRESINIENLGPDINTRITFRVGGMVGETLRPNDLILVDVDNVQYQVRIQRISQVGLRYTQYCDIEGIVEEVRNPQSLSTSVTSRSWSSTSDEGASEPLPGMPLDAPPPDLTRSQVICKYCYTIFRYPQGIGKEYMINGLDKAGLAICRSCFSVLFPGSKLFHLDPPKDIVSTYHNRRKLRIRRKK